MRPKTICMMPMMIENFIFRVLVNEILLIASDQAGSKPKGYGLPEYIFGSLFKHFGSGFKYSWVTWLNVKFVGTPTRHCEPNTFSDLEKTSL